MYVYTYMCVILYVRVCFCNNKYANLNILFRKYYNNNIIIILR